MKKIDEISDKRIRLFIQIATRRVT